MSFAHCLHILTLIVYYIIYCIVKYLYLYLYYISYIISYILYILCYFYTLSNNNITIISSVLSSCHLAHLPYLIYLFILVFLFFFILSTSIFFFFFMLFYCIVFYCIQIYRLLWQLNFPSGMNKVLYLSIFQQYLIILFIYLICVAILHHRHFPLSSLTCCSDWKALKYLMFVWWMPSKVKEQLSARKANVSFLGENTQFIPWREKKSIGSYQWVVVRGRDKGAAGRGVGCRYQTGDSARCMGHWAMEGGGYHFLDRIVGPYMHMGIRLWVCGCGCASLNVTLGEWAWSHVWVCV